MKYEKIKTSLSFSSGIRPKMSIFYGDTIFPKPKTSVKTWKHQKAVKLAMTTLIFYENFFIS